MASDESAEQVKAWNQVKKSILDATLADGEELKARLGTTGRQRLEDHLEAIRDIEGAWRSLTTGWWTRATRH